MDDDAALRARRVAQAASAWLRVPADTEAYRRLVQAVGEWDVYCEPELLEETSPELLDAIDTAAEPQPISALLDDLPEHLRRSARNAL